MSERIYTTLLHVVPMLFVRCQVVEEQVEAAEGWEEYELCPGFDLVYTTGCAVF